MLKPNLFVVGQPRTGTHALHDLLSQHPEIFMSTPKEPVYFAKDLQRESDLFHKKQKYFHFRTEKQYLNLFESSTTEKFAGESSAIYLFSKEAARHIHEFNPEAKIIMIFREPVSWLRSFHSEARHCLGEDQEKLEDALIFEVQRKEWKCLSDRVMAPSLLIYSEFIKYTEQVKRYLDLFSREQIKIIIYDDFRKNNLQIFYEILKFLDIDSNITVQTRRINPSKTQARFPMLQYCLQSPALQKTALRFFPDKVFRKLVRFYWEKLFLHEERADIAPDIRRKLMKRFKPEVEKFSRIIDRDLVTLWGYDQSR